MKRVKINGERTVHWKKECRSFMNSNVRGSDILDLGCGVKPHKMATKTIDIDKDSVADLIHDINLGIPLSSNCMDCIVMNNVLEHIHKPQIVVSECHRVLRKNGELIATVPFFLRIHGEPYDFHRYTNFMLEKLLKDFTTTEITPIGSFKDVYGEMQHNLFGMVGRRNITAYTASRIIRLLTPLVPIPDIFGKTYPQGYLIKAIK